MPVVDVFGGPEPRGLALRVVEGCAAQDVFEDDVGVVLSVLREAEENKLVRIVERSDALLVVRPVDGVDGAVVCG